MEKFSRINDFGNDPGHVFIYEDKNHNISELPTYHSKGPEYFHIQVGWFRSNYMVGESLCSNDKL